MALAQFRAAVAASGLLSADARGEFDAACASTRWAAEDAARWLEERGLVTAWQREQLLGGYSSFKISNYRLLDHLGSGGSGSVFKARHESLDRIVAIKVLNNAQLTNSRVLPRFMREVQAAARLDHPNIITAHDAGVSEGRYFLVMEYADGRDLNAWIKHYGRLPIAWACEFIRQAALGLQHAHEQGLVHRDIKPANLVVIWKDPEVEPVVKILDLGLARSIRETERELLGPDANAKWLDGDTVTQDGQIVGTPDYLSPEQIRGEHVDIRSDVFALGCTLYKLLTGQIPFGGATVFDKLQNRVAEHAPPAVPVRALCPDVPPGLESVIGKMLELSADRRVRRPIDVAEALERFALRKKSKPAGVARNASKTSANSHMGVAHDPTPPTEESLVGTVDHPPKPETYEPPRAFPPRVAAVATASPVAAAASLGAAATAIAAPPVAVAVPVGATAREAATRPVLQPVRVATPVAAPARAEVSIQSLLPPAVPAIAPVTNWAAAAAAARPVLVADPSETIVTRRRRARRRRRSDWATPLIATFIALATIGALLLLLRG